jgi:hypothetical protein
MAETWAQLGPTLTGRPQGVCRGQGERFSSRSLKSARSRRTIALPAVAVEALRTAPRPTARGTARRQRTLAGSRAPRWRLQRDAARMNATFAES